MKNLLYLAILTTIVVLSWVGFGIYNASVTSTITSDTSIAITPIPRDFNKSTIVSIKNKKVIPVDLSQKRSDQIIVSSGAASIQPVNPTPEAEDVSSFSAQVNL